jgi:hypothetical protein
MKDWIRLRPHLFVSRRHRNGIADFVLQRDRHIGRWLVLPRNKVAWKVTFPDVVTAMIAVYG